MSTNPKERPSPESLGYPEGYDPKKVQRKRAQKIGKQLKDARENFARMGAMYEEFGEDEHSIACKTFFIAIDEVLEAFDEFYRRVM